MTFPPVIARRCSTPNRCCSSTTATATSLRSTPSWIRRACRRGSAPSRVVLDRAREQRHLDAELAARLLEGEEVLLGQRLGRRHQRALLAGLDRAQEGVERDDGLAGADLALQKPLHRRRLRRGRRRSRRSRAPGGSSARTAAGPVAAMSSPGFAERGRLLFLAALPGAERGRPGARAARRTPSHFRRFRPRLSTRGRWSTASASARSGR